MLAGQNMGGPTTAVPIVENLRDTWPLHDDLGPITRAQREAIAEAADTIEQLYETLAELCDSIEREEEINGFLSGVLMADAREARAVLSKARGEQ